MQVIANDGSENIRYETKSPSTITVQNVAEDDDTTTSPSGGSSSNSYGLSDSEFSEGETKILREDDEIIFNVNGGSHSVTVQNIGDNNVTLVIASDPQTITLSLGESKKLDLTGDGYYDLFVKFDSFVTSSIVKITTKGIHEKIPAEEVEDSGGTITGDVVDDSTTEGTSGDDEKTTKEKNRTWLIILLIIIIVVIVGIITQQVIKKRKK